MKTKHLLLAFFTMACLNFSTAQEKQNDATWEETIEFLKENIELSDCTLIYKKSADTEYQPCTYEFNNKTMTQIFKIVSRKYNGTIITTKSLRFNEVIDVEINSDDFHMLNIITNEGMVNVTSTATVNGTTDTSKKTFSNFSIPFSNKSTAERFQKAFKHLAYLAKNKESKF